MTQKETKEMSPCMEKDTDQNSKVSTVMVEDNSKSKVAEVADMTKARTTARKKAKDDDVDPNMILNCFRRNDTSISPAARAMGSIDKETKPTEDEEVGDNTPEVKHEEEAASKKQKPVKAKGNSNTQFYVDTFYKNVGCSARSGKSAYLCNEHHERIQKLVRVVGKGEISFFSYLYNVVEHHFSQFHNEIKESYETNNSIF